MGKQRDLLISKLRKVVENGYVPERGKQSYCKNFKGTKNEIAHFVNCFEHSFFNFTNEQLEELFLEKGKNGNSVLKNETEEFWDFESEGKEAKQVFEERLNFVRATGLSVEECKEGDILKDNEWKVAAYFYEDLREANWDFHFIRQESNGFWSSKSGESENVDTYFDAPFLIKIYQGGKRGLPRDYVLKGIYKIRNDYAKTKTKSSNVGKEK